jgi:cell division protein FtsI (penicillin-binding protein 3)
MNARDRPPLRLVTDKEPPAKQERRPAQSASRTSAGRPAQRSESAQPQRPTRAAGSKSASAKSSPKLSSKSSPTPDSRPQQKSKPKPGTPAATTRADGRRVHGAKPSPSTAKPTKNSRPTATAKPVRGPKKVTGPKRHRQAEVAAPKNLSTRAARRAAVLARASSRAKQPSASTPSMWRAGRPRQRLLSIVVGVSLVFVLLTARIALLQTVNASDYVRFGAEQRTRDTDLPAQRGIIFDRGGDALAMSVPAPTIFANPSRIVDPAGTATAIAQLLGFTPERRDALATDFSDGTSKFKYVARQIDDATADAIMSLNLPGIGSFDEQKRVYPAGDVARGLLGTTNSYGEGSTGLEVQYDALLHGEAGRIVRETDQQGRSLPNGERVLEPAIPGQDLRLAISRPIQYEAELALLAKVTENGARGGTAIVMDVDTGELLALASVRRDQETDEVFISSYNIGLVDTYEPGSVAKVITVAAALNEGTVRPDTYFEVPWRKFYSDRYLSDAEQHPTESWPVSKILAKSSNIGTIMISQTIGIAKQEAYMRAFGLGKKTDLDFPGESSGILKPSAKWEGTEKVTPAYGQGVSTTAIQLIGAVNTLANGGTYVAPKLVYSMIDEHGNEALQPPSATHEVVTPAVAAQMNVMMRDVVCRGTASKAKVDGYTIAGKTGTGYKAQKNGYNDENGNKVYYASFVGFFPAEHPEITVLVSIDEPPAGGDHYGGSVAAPVFAEIAQAAIHELNIRPPTADGGCVGV